MCSACFIATIMRLALFACVRKFTARRRTLWINTAANFATHFAFQGYAPRLLATGAFHGHTMFINFFGEFARYYAPQAGFRFTPVKTHTITTATSAAGGAGVIYRVRHE